MSTRHLDWDGCFNARDLGGLPTADGRRTRHRALVRADALDHLTEAGWAALADYGIRTIVDLRNEDELTPDLAPRPSTLTTVHVPLDGTEDTEFWDEWMRSPAFGTPRYYVPHLRRMPERGVAVLRAVAHAEPGGVLVHCGIGRDRTGQATMLLLSFAGVEPDHIAADYALSEERLEPLMARRGEPDHLPGIAAYLAAENTTAHNEMLAALEAVDLHATLRAGGLTDGDVDALRARLLSP